MVDNQQKQPSQAWRPKVISSREAIAIFSGKCHILADLLNRDICSQDKEIVLDSMFQQSARILGEQ